MDKELLDSLLCEASKLGAKGYKVIGWIPPQSASESAHGRLISVKQNTGTASEVPWYDR